MLMNILTYIRRFMCLTLLAMLCSPCFAHSLPVAASFSVLADLVKEVGGDRISVTALVGEDADAHIFQPAPTDIVQLSKTKLFFINGLGLEGWLSRLQQAANYKGSVVVVNAGDDFLMMDEHNSHVPDPHTWQDPVRAKKMINVISTALTKADPAGEAYYRERAKAYQQQLDVLQTWASGEFNKIPAQKRVILTSHDAFGYLGQRFGIKILSPQGVSTDAEPSAKEVGKLIKQIKSEGIHAVFMENISNPKMVKQIAAETGNKLGDKLFSDALSKDDMANTYLKMFRHNVTALVAGMALNQ